MEKIFDNIKPILALIIVISAFVFLFSILFVFRNDPQIVGLALGAVITTMAAATGYYFGSSQGLSQANDTIANSASNPLIQNSESTIVK